MTIFIQIKTRMSNVKINEIEISCTGIDYLVNNDWDACEKLFNTYK